MSRTYDQLTFDGLSVRALNCLENAGIVNCNESFYKQKSAVVAALRIGTLRPGKIRQYGELTHEEVCRWAGYFPKVERQMTKSERLLFYPKKDWAQIYAAMDKR